MDFWVNFASSGNPNGDGLPEWKQFNSNADEMMELGSKVGMTGVERVEKYNVVMKAIDRQLAAIET